MNRTQILIPVEIIYDPVKWVLNSGPPLHYYLVFKLF
jgi:hypothetical protein